MTLEVVKERFEYILNTYKERFDGSDLVVDAKITYQNDECNDCEENDPKMTFVCGEFFVRLPDMEEENGLGYCMIVDCQKKDKIDEKKFNIEATEFCESMDKMVKEMEDTIDLREYIVTESQKAEEESEKLLKQFETANARINKLYKIAMIASAAGVALVILLAILL